MLLRIMNHLPSGTDFPERFQISVLYRISLMVSIGILHKFTPSIFNSTAVIPDVCGHLRHPASSHECIFSRLARSLTATCCFARVHIKSGSPCPQYMFCRHSILFIIYVFPSGSRQDFLSLLRSPRYQSAERQKRQNIRNDHKPVKEVR